MKAQSVPNHYSITLNPEEMRSLVLGFRTYVREYYCTDDEENMLSILEEAYQGELGNPPSQLDPVSDN